MERRRSADPEEDARLLDRCEAKRKNRQSTRSVLRAGKLWKTSLGRMKS